MTEKRTTTIRNKFGIAREIPYCAACEVVEAKKHCKECKADEDAFWFVVAWFVAGLSFFVALMVIVVTLDNKESKYDTRKISDDRERNTNCGSQIR